MTCQGSHQTFIFGKHLRQCLLTRKMFLDSEITKNNPHVAKRHVFKEKERVPIKRLSARSKPWIRQCASTAWSCITMGAAVFSLPVMPIGCCSENENLSLLSFVPLPTDYILQLLFSVLSPVPSFTHRDSILTCSRASCLSVTGTKCKSSQQLPSQCWTMTQILDRFLSFS